MAAPIHAQVCRAELLARAYHTTWGVPVVITRAVAVAGVMGGANSEVSPETTRVLLESAYFLPASIHRTSRALGLVSDAKAALELFVQVAREWKAAGRLRAVAVVNLNLGVRGAAPRAGSVWFGESFAISCFFVACRQAATTRPPAMPRSWGRCRSPWWWSTAPTGSAS